MAIQTFEAGGPSGSEDSSPNRIDKPCNNNNNGEIGDFSSNTDSQSKTDRVLGLTLLNNQNGLQVLGSTLMNNTAAKNNAANNFNVKATTLFWGGLGLVTSTTGMLASPFLGPAGPFAAYSSAMGFASSLTMLSVALTGNNTQIADFNNSSSLFSLTGISALTIATLSGMSAQNSSNLIALTTSIETLSSPSLGQVNSATRLIERIQHMGNQYQFYESSKYFYCELRKSTLP